MGTAAKIPFIAEPLSGTHALAYSSALFVTLFVLINFDH
jgi:hypothetical protein